MVHKIYEEEAAIVRRMYKEFTEGKSINSITQNLNENNIPTKRNLPGGWNTSTISNILKNEKYKGKWVWRKWKNVVDPISGKRKKVERAEKEKMVFDRKEIAIIDEDTWGKHKKDGNL